MDEATRDLVLRLCTRAGMMMEDASASAIMLPAGEPIETQAIERIRRDVLTIGALVEAALQLAKSPEC